MSNKVLQLHKRDSYEFKYIQDKYAINPKKRTFALADGTTQSFYSEIWAKIITNKFVSSPTFNANELIGLFKQSIGDYKSSNFEFSSNPAKASLEKAKQRTGGTATFIGLQFIGNNMLDIISCGDSNSFLLSAENKIDAFPFSDVDSLDANKHFINTEQLFKNNVDKTFFKQERIKYNPGDRIILTTDALSRLILKRPQVLSELLKIDSFDQLKDFCLKYWGSKELEEDDISAIIINTEDISHTRTIQPPSNFSFPKEKENKFIPSPLTPKNELKFTDMQMNEIKNQFNGVARDFHQVKKKLEVHGILLNIAIGLLIANIILMYYFRPTNGIDATNVTKSEKVSEMDDTQHLPTSTGINDSLGESNKASQSNNEEDQDVKNESSDKTSEPTNEEVKTRQPELKDAGNEKKVDSMWGHKKIIYWYEYQLKR